MLIDRLIELNNGEQDPPGQPWTLEGELMGYLSEPAATLAQSLWGPDLNASSIDDVHRLCSELLPGPVENYEHFDLVPACGGNALTTVPRTLVTQLGIQAFGVHANGYVKKHGELFMWVAKRSLTKATFPGQWDNLVGGGLTAGYTADEILAKESMEEANLDLAIAKRVESAGVIQYCHRSHDGLRRNALHLFDIELPLDWTPEPNDGEVEGFELWDMQRLRNVVEQTQEFKYNCSAIVIDFMLRHGVIADDDPAYSDLKTLLNERFQTR